MLYRNRGIHLDFHTSPYIPNIGGAFDKKFFQKMLIKGKIQTVTLFAKCHHGYCYYPTNVGTMHPHLDFDLLAAQIEAAHEIGVKTPIYIPIGWSDLDVREHPEWCAYDFYTKKVMNNGFDLSAKGDEVPNVATWVNLCPSGEYLEYLEQLTTEICERYAPVDGLFYDICFFTKACACPNCVENMKKRGLNPENEKDAEKYFESMRVNMMERLNAIIYKYNPSATVFYNGSTVQNNPVYMQHQSHYEIEVLPTVCGEFDETDFHVRKLEGREKDILGMTGKFQTCWGEYGGYKNSEALKYECANGLSLGIGMIVGDHCHPDGRLDEATYSIIGDAYAHMEKLESICLPTKRVADVGVVISKNGVSNKGVSSFLLENKIDYKIVQSAQDIEGLKLLILPDGVDISLDLATSIKEYAEKGGAIILSGESVKDVFLGVEYISKPINDVSYVLPNFDIGLLGSPMLINNPIHIIEGAKAGFESIASVSEPYFNRTYEHFSGHRNTPNKREKSDKSALLKKGKIACFANAIFAEYEEYGSVYVRRYLDEIFKELYPERIVLADDMLTAGRVRLRKNEEKQYYALYLLYAVQTKRGKCFVLDDFPTFKQTKISLLLPENITSATLQPQNITIPVKRVGERTEIVVDEWKSHQLIVLNWLGDKK